MAKAKKAVDRKSRMIAYNKKYKIRDTDIPARLSDYFEERGWDVPRAIDKALLRAAEIDEKREWKYIDITMYEYPIQTDRPRVFRNHIYSPNANAMRRYFESALKAIGEEIKLIATPSIIQIDGYIEMPSTIKPHEVLLYETGVLEPITKPDADNLGKTYLDMMLGSLILDDDIFYTMIISKHYSVMPRVEIKIAYLSEQESENMKKKIQARKSVKAAIDAGICVIGGK